MKIKKILLMLSVILMFACFGIGANAATPKAPKAPVIDSVNVASSGKIKVEWDAVTGAAKYKVYRGTSLSGKYTLQKTVTETSYVNTSAVAGKKYYYYVVAVNKKGVESKKSNKVSRVCDLPQPKITSITNVGKTGKIEVKWSKVAGAKSYKLYRSTSKNGTYTVLKTTTDTSYLNTNATPGKLYYYKVKAIHKVAAGHSAFSAIKTRRCDLAQPVVKTSNVESSGKIKLTWKAVTGAKSYKVYRATSKSGTYSLMKTVTGTTYTNTTAKAGKTYYYKVKAIAANTDANSIYSVVVEKLCKLPRPSNVKAVLNNGRPMIAWTAVDGANYYEIYRSTSETGKYKLLAYTDGTSFAHKDASLGTTHYYKVKAVHANADATSALSLAASVKTGEYEKRYVSRHQIYAYTQADSASESICMPYMAEFDLGKAVHEYSSGNWYKIRYNSKIYYLWVATGDEKFTDKKSSFKYTAKNAYAQEIVDKAVMIATQWDTEYKTKQSTGEKNENGKYGFDCSGYVTYCINTVMQKYNGAYRIIGDTDTLYEQVIVYNEGLTGEFKAKTVSIDNIQPGDLIFLDMSGNGMNHVGIYLGNGELAHIGNFWNKVTIMPLEGYFEERVCRVRRFIPDEVTPANKPMYAKYNGVPMYADRTSESKKLYECSRNEKVALLFTNSNSEWAYCKTSGGKMGFIWMKNLNTSTKEYQKKYVALHQIYAYVEPDSNTEQICMPYMSEIELGEIVHEWESGNWYEILYEGKNYYLWVEAGDEKFTDTRSSFQYTAENPYAQEIIDKAMMIYNEWDTYYTNYDSTGTPDENGKYGFDCSGYTTYCVNSVMQKYNPSFRLVGNTGVLFNQNNIYNAGLNGQFDVVDVPMDEIKPGDFIFLAMSEIDDTGMNHVGIYLGNGELAHCAGFWNKVTIMPLEGYFEERVCGVRRFIPEEVTPANKTMYAAGKWVNMYADKSSSSEIVYTFSKNETVTVLFANADPYKADEAPTWYYCRTSNGTEGYITPKNLGETEW